MLIDMGMSHTVAIRRRSLKEWVVSWFPDVVFFWQVPEVVVTSAYIWGPERTNFVELLLCRFYFSQQIPLKLLTLVPAAPAVPVSQLAEPVSTAA